MQVKDTRHILQKIGDGYTCSRCGLTWKQEPDGLCPGAKVYGYKAIPWDTLATHTMLRRQKLKPADPDQPDGCYFRSKREEYIYLYRIDQAQARRVPTQPQREAIVKMREGLMQKYTCARCGFYDDSHGLRGRRHRYNKIRTLKVEGEEKRYCDDCQSYFIWAHDRRVIEHNMRITLERQETQVAVIDTETTGLPGDPAFQVVEIAMVDTAGKVLFHSLVKPDIPMPAQAAAIHGLTDEHLAAAPGFTEIWPQLSQLLGRYELWAYNADFDQSAIIASAERFQLDIPDPIANHQHWHCLMWEFARYYGAYSPYYGRDKWQTLGTACDELGVEGSGYHRAFGDALNALGVMKALAVRGGEGETPEERPTGYYGEGY